MSKRESVHQITQWQKKRIKELIDEELLQKVIAKRVGVSYATVNRIALEYRQEKKDGSENQSGK